MASAPKVALAASLFGLVLLGAILSYYFTLAGAVSSDYSFEGSDGAGNQIRVTSNSGAVDIEILSNPTNSDSTWTLFKISSAAPIGYSFTAGDANWKCSQQESSAGVFDDADVSSAGQDLFNKIGAEGSESLVYIKVSGHLVGVALSKNGITNFAGYAATSFAFGPSTLASFKTGLPALPAAETCTAAVATPARSDAVVESNSAPVCASFPSLFAFLAKRVYSDVSSNSWCSTSATATSCAPVVKKQDNWGFGATDRILKCRNVSTFGTIITFSGTNFYEITDWLRNFSIATNYKSALKLSTHDGFQHKYNMFLTEVASYVGTISKGDNVATSNKITFNGHSLGGAMAQIGGATLKAANAAWNVAVVSFGAPSPFKGINSASVWHSIKHARYVNYWADVCVFGLCTISQRDMVSGCTDLAFFEWAPNSQQIQSNVKTIFGFNTDSPPVIPFVSDFIVATIWLHESYPEFADNARGNMNYLSWS